MHLNQPIVQDLAHRRVNILLEVHVVGGALSLRFHGQAVAIDVAGMLSDALRIKVVLTVLKVNSLLENSTDFEIVVESKNFDPMRRLSMPFD